MSGRARVLIVSHTGRKTGFGRVAVGIANALAAHHVVCVLGISGQGDGEAWRALGATAGDLGCSNALREWLRNSETDLVLLIGVNTLLAWQADRIRRDGYRGIIVGYVPVEGPIGNPHRLAGLAACTQVVAYTQTSSAELGKIGLRNVAEHIFHGVGTHAIGPPPPRDRRAAAALRQRLLPGIANPDNAILILNGNRNDPRKCPEFTLQAFSAIAHLAPDAMLVMHCSPQRPGLSLKVECDRLGLSKRVIFTHDLVPEPWSEEQLDGLYQCCEIGMSSSWGEGWGLVSFEHALRGGAQILPAHPSLREIWVDAPVWAAVGLARPIDNVSFGFAPDVSALSLAMSQLLTDPSARTRIAAACHTHASRRVFHWDEIGGQWLSRVDHLLRGAISNPKENCAVIHSAFSN